MYLKSLHVVGFKSFADRAQLDFHRGVTAIVGPNGCGKSNVLDSIRWVLGEQSAKALRGGEMKDVIFSGSDTRPPLGMAEVALTFAECETLGLEYHEITITRRVFRDGTSEYELNKTICRLRDIQTLFMDTGIGRTAYSIMEQGKIDQILSSRPEDRRAIFEEAAGITKYRSQKREALRKLEQTEANLVRLADIIREVKRQIGSLQRQAGKARRYQASFAQLSELEQRWVRHQFGCLNGAIAGLQELVEGTRAELTGLSDQLGEREAAVSALRNRLQAVESSLIGQRELQATLKQTIAQAEQRSQTNRGRVTEFTLLQDQAEREISATEEKIRIGEEHLAEIEAKLHGFIQEKRVVQDRFDAAQNTWRELSDQVSELAAARTEAESERFRQESRRRQLEQELAALESQQREFESRLEARQKELAVIREEHAAGEARVAASSTALTEAEQNLIGSRATLQSAQSTRRELADSLLAEEQSRNKAAHECQNLVARRDALVQLEEQHASAPPAAQRLLKGENGSELRGTLANYLSVQAGFELPLALLLGHAVHALVVADSAGALAWRARLQAKESCAFAPQSAVRSAPQGNLEPTHALNFVQVQPAVCELVATLLDDAHVVDNLAAAWELKASRPERVVATRAGELVTRGGLLLVGQETGGGALVALTRQGEIRQLDTLVNSARQAVACAEDRVTKGQHELAAKTDLVEQARADLQAAEIEAATQRQQSQAAGQELRQRQRQIDEAEREIARLRAQEAADQKRQVGLREAQTVAEEKMRLAIEQEAKLSAGLAELSRGEEAAQEALTELRITLATRAQQLEAGQEQRKPILSRLQDSRERVEQRRRESRDHAERVARAEAEIAAAIAAEQSATEQLATCEAGLAATLGQKQEAQAAIDEAELGLRSSHRRQAEVQAARSENEIKLAEHKLLLGNLRDRFRRDYQKELEEIPTASASEETTDWSALEAEVTAQRAALDALGPVNLEAITEFEELEQRHQFLTDQERDLITAKEQLLQAIQEINRTTQKLFAETFNQVKINFQAMFQELFGGGKATLELTEPADPLESGIEIVAKPPGKQPQSVTLLSGGEKTMTAVALLFAIYLVKPSPFCVLDEMDAPLDESNINRFISILQRFRGKSQFIVITHNKRTIGMADVLYGVTMEDRGVSRFVSMRLAGPAAEKAAPELVSINQV